MLAIGCRETICSDTVKIRFTYRCLTGLHYENIYIPWSFDVSLQKKKKKKKGEYNYYNNATRLYLYLQLYASSLPNPEIIL